MTTDRGTNLVDIYTRVVRLALEEHYAPCMDFWLPCRLVEAVVTSNRRIRPNLRHHTLAERDGLCRVMFWDVPVE